MTLGTLVLYIAIASLVVTGLIIYRTEGEKNWVTSFLQNFCGLLFIVSGWVKAVDPMGTAFKMEQYFAEFAATFEGTWFGFLAPLFPWLSTHSISFSVFMIVLEIIVGVMLVIGHKPKFTAWVFLVTIVFFTILTGFTFLTGYVPTDANFFSFSSWSGYDVANMRVTDCGCFGDFIKLEPRTSFFKDIFLLVPSLWLVARSKQMHQLFTGTIRTGIVAVSLIGLLIYCWSNYRWDLPHADFRPFKEGVNIYEVKQIEEEAAASVQVVGWQLQNKGTNEVIELSSEDYLGNMGDYPKEKWEVLKQITSEPAIEPTKISDFEIVSSNGEDMTYDILTSQEALLMIVSYKLKGEQNYDGQSVSYAWDAGFIEKYTEVISPLMNDARGDGISGFVVAGGAGGDKLEAFAKATGLSCPMYEADDIMLKTIIRSNPGVVLLQNGQILGKWHITKVPEWSEMKGLVK